MPLNVFAATSYACDAHFIPQYRYLIMHKFALSHDSPDKIFIKIVEIATSFRSWKLRFPKQSERIENFHITKKMNENDMKSARE